MIYVHSTGLMKSIFIDLTSEENETIPILEDTVHTEHDVYEYNIPNSEVTNDMLYVEGKNI